MNGEHDRRGAIVAKLDDSKAAQIIERIAAGEALTRIAAAFGVRESAIRCIRDGRSYKRLPRPFDLKQCRRCPTCHRPMETSP